MKFTEYQFDLLKELINIGIGNGANLLNKMVHKPVKLTPLDLKIIDVNEVGTELNNDEEDNIVGMNFSGVLQGRGGLVFPKESVTNLVHLMAPAMAEINELSNIHSSVILEVGNIVINGVLGSLSNSFKTQFRFSLPSYELNTILDWSLKMGVGQLIIAKTRFEIEEYSISGNILVFLEIKSFEILKKMLDEMMHKV